MEISQGFNICGILKGIAPDGQYLNLGIAEESKDEFGEPTTNMHRISITQQHAERLQAKVNALKGKKVICNVAVVMRRSPRTGNNYQSIFIHQNSDIQLVQQMSQHVEKAS